jgi:RND superfamily putative drug exporter
MQELSKEDLAKAESAGFPVVLLILLFVFGSLAAAALPLALGFVAVLVTGALIYVLSQSMEMSVFVTNMASMIGIGVAVDYSLFIVARYREEVGAGRPPDEARGIALATSGLAVLFSGLTVIISLAGLWMVDNTAIRSMALGAMLVVAVAVLAATTLLPVLLGRRAVARSRYFSLTWLLRRKARERSGPGFWQRWTDGVMRRPVLAVTATTAVLLALAAPVLGLSTSTGALDQFPADHEARQGFEAAAALTGPGASSPVRVVVSGDGAPAAAERVLTLVFGPVDTLTPPLVLAVVFGLSMDYEVFLLSRIRERYEVTGDTRTAVAEGLAASARTITSAALIMVAVFGVFIAVGVPSIQQIGLGTAVAIALDATLVRLILVPAAMELLGDWNWYLPRPLARILPRADFEAVAPQAAR